MSRTPQQPPSKLDYETAADIERAEHEVITSSSAQQFPPSSRSRKFLTKLLWLQIILPAASICLCIVIFALESYGRKRYHYRKLPPFDGLHVALTFWVVSAIPYLSPHQEYFAIHPGDMLTFMLMH